MTDPRQTYRSLLCISFFLLMLVAGCTSIRPELYPEPAVTAPPTHFDYQSYQRMLTSFVDHRGGVNYAELVKNRGDMEAFYGQIAAHSPDSHPSLFTDEKAQLAYWINSYNLTTIRGVVQHYPISSVEDVPPPLLLFFLPRKSGFFFFQRFTYGGVETSLYYLENQVIRKRFVDPRYHFALNCASKSCPELPREPFYPDRLDEQLDREAANFINDKRHVLYDAESKTLYLSSIFDWYESDFISWLRAGKPVPNKALVDYVLLYLEEQTARQVKDDRDGLNIAFLPYDWGLNDASSDRNTVK